MSGGSAPLPQARAHTEPMFHDGFAWSFLESVKQTANYHKPVQAQYFFIRRFLRSLRTAEQQAPLTELAASFLNQLGVALELKDRGRLDFSWATAQQTLNHERNGSTANKPATCHLLPALTKVLEQRGCLLEGTVKQIGRENLQFTIQPGCVFEIAGREYRGTVTLDLVQVREWLSYARQQRAAFTLRAHLKTQFEQLAASTENRLEKPTYTHAAAQVDGMPIHSLVLLAASHAEHEIETPDEVDPPLPALKAGLQDIFSEVLSDISEHVEAEGWETPAPHRYHSRDFLTNFRDALLAYQASRESWLANGRPGFFKRVNKTLTRKKLAWVEARLTEIDELFPLEEPEYFIAFQKFSFNLILFLKVSQMHGKAAEELDDYLEIKSQGLTPAMGDGELGNLVSWANVVRLNHKKDLPKLKNGQYDTKSSQYLLNQNYIGWQPVMVRSGGQHARFLGRQPALPESEQIKHETFTELQDAKTQLDDQIQLLESWNGEYPGTTRWIRLRHGNENRREIHAHLTALRAVQTAMLTAGAHEERTPEFVAAYNAFCQHPSLTRLQILKASDRLPKAQRDFIDQFCLRWHDKILPKGWEAEAEEKAAGVVGPDLEADFVPRAKQTRFELVGGGTAKAGEAEEYFDPDRGNQSPGSGHSRHTDVVVLDNGKTARLVDLYANQYQASYDEVFETTRAQSIERQTEAFRASEGAKLRPVLELQFDQNLADRGAQITAAVDQQVRSYLVQQQPHFVKQAELEAKRAAEKAAIRAVRVAHAQGKQSVRVSVGVAASPSTEAIRAQQEADMAARPCHEPVVVRENALRRRDLVLLDEERRPTLLGMKDRLKARNASATSWFHQRFHSADEPKISEVEKAASLHGHYRLVVETDRPSPFEWLQLVEGSLYNYVQLIDQEKKTKGKAKRNQDMAIEQLKAVRARLAKYDSLAPEARATEVAGVCAGLLAVDTSKSGSFNGRYSRFRKLMDEVKKEAQGYRYQLDPEAFRKRHLNSLRYTVGNHAGSLKASDMNALGDLRDNPELRVSLDYLDQLSNHAFRNSDLKYWAKQYRSERAQMRSVTWTAEVSAEERPVAELYQHSAELKKTKPSKKAKPVSALRQGREKKGQDRADVVIVANPKEWLKMVASKMTTIEAFLSAKEVKCLAPWKKELAVVSVEFAKPEATDDSRHAALQVFAKFLKGASPQTVTGVDYQSDASAPKSIDPALAHKHQLLQGLFDSAVPYTGKAPNIEAIHRRNQNRLALSKAMKAAQQIEMEGGHFPPHLGAINLAFRTDKSPSPERLMQLAQHAHQPELQRWLRIYISEVMSYQNMSAGFQGLEMNNLKLPELNFPAPIPLVPSVVSLDRSSATASPPTVPPADALAVGNVAMRVPYQEGSDDESDDELDWAPSVASTPYGSRASTPAVPAF